MHAALCVFVTHSTHNNVCASDGIDLWVWICVYEGERHNKQYNVVEDSALCICQIDSHSLSLEVDTLFI